jgi:hypothetical protein
MIFIICSDQIKMDELGVASHMLGIDEMHVTFWVDSLKGIDHF